MMNRNRKILLTFAGLAAVIGIAGCGGAGGKPAASSAAAKADPVTVKLGYTPSLCQAPLFIAKEKDFYKEAGVNVELVPVDGAHANEAIGSGKIDAMQTLVMKTIKPWQNGLPVKATAGIHSGCVRVVARNDGSVNTAADLKGKKLGVAGLADTGTIVAQRALKLAGVNSTPDNMEVELVVIDRNSLPQALESGQVDAIAMTDPVGALAEKQYGFKTIVDTATSPEFKDEYCCDLVIADKLLKEHPEAAKRLTAAVMKGSLYVHDHLSESVKILADKKYVSGDPAFNESLLATYNYKPSVKGGYTALQDSAQDLGDLGLVKKTDGKKFADQYFFFFDGLADTPTL